MAPTINFAGLASGIDTNALIDATSEATRKTREQPKKDKIDELSRYNSALDDMEVKLQALKDSAEDMNTIAGGAVAKTATSSAETIATASVANGAANGSYTIGVTQVATAGSFSFDYNYTGSSDTVATLTSSPDTIHIYVGDTNTEDVAISVTNTMTVAEFVNQFNQTSTRAEASIVQVASGQYRIMINSNKTGTDEGAITVTVGMNFDLTGVPSKLDPDPAETTESAAQDAQFTLNGIGPFTRSSNNVNDVITGVTFNLISGPGTATITVANDEETTTSLMKKFIDAYNEIITYYNENDGITSEADSTGNTVNVFGSLATDRTDDSAIEMLRSALSSIRYDSSTTIAIPADLGISTQRDGTLKFDERQFKTALSTDPDAVNEISMTMGDKYGGTYSSTTGNGIVDSIIGFNRIFDTTKNSNRTLIDDLNEQIAEIEKQILETEASMRARFATLESTMGRLQSQQQQLTSALASLG